MQYGQQSMDPPPSSIIGGQLQGYGGIGHVSVMVCLSVCLSLCMHVCVLVHTWCTCVQEYM